MQNIRYISSIMEFFDYSGLTDSEVIQIKNILYKDPSVKSIENGLEYPNSKNGSGFFDESPFSFLQESLIHEANDHTNNCDDPELHSLSNSTAIATSHVVSSKLSSSATRIVSNLESCENIKVSSTNPGNNIYSNPGDNEPSVMLENGDATPPDTDPPRNDAISLDISESKMKNIDTQKSFNLRQDIPDITCENQVTLENNNSDTDAILTTVENEQQQLNIEPTTLSSESTSYSENVPKLISPANSEPSPESMKPKAWSSLFKNTTKPAQQPQNITSTVRSSTVYINHVNDSQHNQELEHLVDLLTSLTLHHKSVGFIPRGYYNKGTSCYINAALQSVLSTPSFYNLMTSISSTVIQTLYNNQNGPSTLLLAMSELVQTYTPWPQRSKSNNSQGLVVDECIDPSFIVEAVNNSKSCGRQFDIAHQEDADEFLSCLLNILHDDFRTFMNLSAPTDSEFSHLQENNSIINSGITKENIEIHDNGWEPVRRKYKGLSLRSETFGDSLVSDIFAGWLMISIHQPGVKTSAIFQPFFTLPLHIQDDKISSVKEALQTCFSTERLTSDGTSKKSITQIQKLPLTLILQLKRFIYLKGKAFKLTKNLHIPTKLTINEEWLSKEARSASHVGQRTYRLQAVISHHGQKIEDGHYTCDTFHTGLQWVHYDDTTVKTVPESYVLHSNIRNRTPYVLFYRRCDIIYT